MGQKFFISFNAADQTKAHWIAWTLKEGGHEVAVHDWEIPAGGNAPLWMNTKLAWADRLIAVISPDYLPAHYSPVEWASQIWNDPAGTKGSVIPVIVRPTTKVPPLLNGLSRIDLTNCSEAEAKSRLIKGVEIPAPPGRKPAFEKIEGEVPDSNHAGPAEKPIFIQGNVDVPSRPFIGVPPRIASFTGRADELNRLDAILMQDKPAAVTQASVGRAAVQGMGGVGKTSLAVEYAYRFRGLYAGVCWCPAESRQRLLTSLAALAAALGAAAADEADIAKAARAALRWLAEQRGTWLLIYDNVTSPQEIADLLPTAGARVLITSRFSDWAAWADEVALDLPTLEEAVTFLQRRAWRHDEGGATVLAEAVDRLPLALDHAAAFCRARKMRFADYAAQASSRIAASPPRSAAYPRSVAATFDLAITEAVAQCANAEALMEYLAQCAPERIPMTLVEGAMADEGIRLDALAALTEMSLVKDDKFDDGTDAVTVHRLVQTVARVRSEASGTANDAAARLITRLEADYPRDGYSNPASWSRCAHYTPHLLAVCAIEPADGAAALTCSDLLGRAGAYFHGRAAYLEARPLYERALAIDEKVRGPEHPDTASRLNNLAALLKDQGDLAGARPLYERALAIREKVLSPEHPDTATSLNNFANLLRDQGDLAGARLLFERALAIREKVLGPEHPDTADGLNNLTALLHDQGDPAGARLLYDRAVAIREKVLGPKHPLTANGLNNLAYLLREQGDYAGARPLFERALATSENVLGPEHRLTATSLNNLANLLKDQGDLAGARP
jgi:tetratricopeptide (TPR) repeat protein